MDVTLTTLKEFLAGLTPISNPAGAGVGSKMIVVWAFNVTQFPGSCSYNATFFSQLWMNGIQTQYSETEARFSAADLNNPGWWETRGSMYFGTEFPIMRLNPLNINLTSSVTLGTTV
jgi:hypothetical protein